jgi:hypothetical protein
MSTVDVARYVRLGNGSFSRFCCEDHRVRWWSAMKLQLQEGTVTLDVTGGRARSCEHCAWCSARATMPSTGWCPQHAPGRCSTFSMGASICGLRAVVALQSLNHGRLSDDAISIVEEVALQLHDEGRFPSVDLIYASWIALCDLGLAG